MARNWAADGHYASRFNSGTAAEEAARTIAADYQSSPLGATSARLITMLVSLTGAKNVIELGTGTGTSTLAILAGLGAGGMLTSVDVDRERQAVAAELADVAGFRSHRLRFIQGLAESVLHRLSPSGYDFVFVDTDPAGFPDVVPEALSKVRPGGLLVVNDALGSGTVADPAARDASSTALRHVLAQLQDSPDRVLLPIEAGLLAVRRRA